MDPVTILGLVNTASQITAYLIDQAKAAGATPEQIAEARAKALERFDQAAKAVAGAVPPVA